MRETSGRTKGGLARLRTGFVLLVVGFPVLRDGGAQTTKPGPRPFSQRDRAHALERNQSFLDLATVRLTPGGGLVNLNVQFAENSLGQDRLRHLSYNGGLLGPTLRVRPGDTLQIHLANHLPPGTPGGGHDGDGPADLHTTNLHTHGLHVFPSAEGDNVFLQVKPGEAFTYKFRIPKDHPPGTFWYHAHKHGSVAFQLYSGLAGALIVEGGLDDTRELRGVKERILVFQQFRYRRSPGRPAEVVPEDVYGTPSPESVTLTAINGVVTPVISMQPGEVQRWRLIHAGIDATIRLNLEGHALNEIAADGLALGGMKERPVLELQPGYRSDVLVKASTKPGDYLLYTEVPEPERAVKGRLVPRTYVAKVVIAEQPREMSLPDPAALAPYAPFAPVRDEEIVRRRELKLRVEGGQGLIDDKVFDPDRTDQTIRLGTAEEWVITSETERHPFHLHVNPFEVLVTNKDTGKVERLWRDTIFVAEGESVTLRTRFADFPGRTVLHCHNLDHEDRGMMQAVEVVPAGGPPARPQGRGAADRRGLAQVPGPAPDWSLIDAQGRVVSSRDFRGRGLLLVLHRGLGCPHCAEQLKALARLGPRLGETGVGIVAASPDVLGGEQVRFYRQRHGVRFPLLAAPGLDVFRDYGCLEGGTPLHGTFLIDAEGQVRWQSVGTEPETDYPRLLSEAGRLTLPRK